MRILVVSSAFYPDNYHINQIVQDLAVRGHVVKVLTGQPDYATGCIPKEYKWLRKYHDFLGKVEIWRAPIIARRKGAIMRFFSYLSFIISGIILALFKKWPTFDTIYVWGVSPVTMAIPAIFLKKRYKKTLFFYCLDLWPESMKAFKVGEKNPVFQAVGILCKWIYKQFDMVAVTSEPFKDYISEVNCYPRKKIVYLPQYGADNYLNKDFTAKDNGIIDFLFAGNVGFVQDIDKIIEAVDKIKDIPGFVVHIVGDGAARSKFENLAKRKKLADKIIFHGRVPLAKMDEFYKLADACLLTLDGSSKIGDTLPVKMQGYMAAGKPVIAAVNGAGKKVIKESDCGLVVDAGDIDGLSSIMREFIENKEKYISCGQKGRGYFKQNFTKEKHLEKLETLLGALIK